MTMPDPLNLREFSYDVQATMDAEGQAVYAYRMRLVRGALLEWESPYEPLLARTAEAAAVEARNRALQVMALVQGATIESLEPRGIGDDGQPVA